MSQDLRPSPPAAGRAPLDEALRRLSGVILSEESLDDILDLIVKLAPCVGDAIDAASVSLRSGSAHSTISATSSEVVDVDAVQYDDGRGPCVTAIDEAREIDSDVSSNDPRWPRFAEAARAAGIRRVLSLPIGAEDAPGAALNLYSRRVEPFPESDVVAARLLVGQCHVVLANTLAYSAQTALADQLQEALASRDVIGQAKGLLMASENVDGDRAFDLLRRLSQRTNRKLRDIAAEIVKQHERGDGRARTT